MSYIGNPIVSTDFPVDYFSGNGSTTAFTLSIAPASVNAIDVEVSGVSQSPQTYTLSGTTLTFSAAPPTGSSNIVVKHRGIAGVPNVPAVGSVTSTSLATQDLAINGVTVGKGGGSVSTNTIVGVSPLNSNTTGASNTAVGYQAGYVSTGDQNTYVGQRAGYTQTSGSLNTFVGYNAGNGNSGANNYNVGVGAFCFSNLSTGQYNTAVGYQSLQSNTTASYNVAVGRQALYTSTGAENTAIGQQALYALTTGYNNTAIGTGAGAAITTGHSNVIIGTYNGNQGGLDIRTASNYIVLSDGDGNLRARWNTNGQMRTVAAQTDAEALVIENSQATRPYGVDIFFSGTTPNNTTQYFISGEDTTNAKFYIYSNGTMSNRTGTYNTISDAKLKENIIDASPKLDKLMQTRVVNYNLIGDDLKQIGFVAQELEQVFPALIDNVPDLDENKQPTGEITKAVKLTVMIPILVKAIQELKAELATLKTTVETQATEIAALKGVN